MVHIICWDKTYDEKATEDHRGKWKNSAARFIK